MSATNLSAEDGDFLVDVADRGAVSLTPRVENVRNIIIEVSRAILVNAPMHSITKMKEGILGVESSSHVWGGITASELHQLYRELLPTPEKIASMLSANCADREEERVFSFLRRYVRSLNQVDAVTFLRWITAGTCLWCSSRYLIQRMSNNWR